MRNGFALITVLVVLIMIAFGAATVFQAVGSHASMKTIGINELKAQYIAEAGMQRAIVLCKETGACPADQWFSDEEMPYHIISTLEASGRYRIRVEVDY